MGFFQIWLAASLAIVISLFFFFPSQLWISYPLIGCLLIVSIAFLIKGEFSSQMKKLSGIWISFWMFSLVFNGFPAFEKTFLFLGFVFMSLAWVDFYCGSPLKEA